MIFHYSIDASEMICGKQCLLLDLEKSSLTDKKTKVTCEECLEKIYSDFKFITQNPDSGVFYVLAEQKSTGNQVAMVSCIDFKKGYLPIVQNLWVDHEFRGLGLATQMMRLLVKKCGTTMCLNARPFLCEEDNEEEKKILIPKSCLMSFYENFGFKAISSNSDHMVLEKRS